jgi:hypothetical protein
VVRWLRTEGYTAFSSFTHPLTLPQRWTVKRLRLMPISYADSFRLVYVTMAGVGLVLAAWVLLR